VAPSIRESYEILNSLVKLIRPAVGPNPQRDSAPPGRTIVCPLFASLLWLQSIPRYAASLAGTDELDQSVDCVSSPA